MDKVYLQAISYYFPNKCLTNEDLSELHPEWVPEKIAKKTGILKRYIADKNETAVDMALKSAEKLFVEHSIDKQSIDFLILCTQSPDYFLPTSACILQDKLGLSENCGAFDYNLGCSGYVYGLSIAKSLIYSGQAKNVLLITSETYTKYLHPNDKSCHTIFGDAAAASFINNKYIEGLMNAEICHTTYRTIGSHYKSLIIKNGCSRNAERGFAQSEYNEEGAFIKNDDYLFMDGKDIFEFSSFVVPEVVKLNIAQNYYKFDDIDLFVFHQANQYMLNFVRMRCDIPTDKFIIDLKDGGNTVSSTIPIILSKLNKNKQLNKGANILLCGFGVGLSVASTILKIN